MVDLRAGFALPVRLFSGRVEGEEEEPRGRPTVLEEESSPIIRSQYQS